MYIIGKAERFYGDNSTDRAGEKKEKRWGVHFGSYFIGITRI